MDVVRASRQVEAITRIVGDVDAARRDVGRDQRAHAAAPHAARDCVVLVHVAMQRGGRVAFALSFTASASASRLWI
jgi:hypothetical protein